MFHKGHNEEIPKVDLNISITKNQLSLLITALYLIQSKTNEQIYNERYIEQYTKKMQHLEEDTQDIQLLLDYLRQS